MKFILFIIIFSITSVSHAAFEPVVENNSESELAKANKWLKMAYDGNYGAAVNVHYLYTDLLFPESIELRRWHIFYLKLLREAAKNGSESAKYSLGNFYNIGYPSEGPLMIKPDLEKAFEYLHINAQRSPGHKGIFELYQAYRDGSYRSKRYRDIEPITFEPDIRKAIDLLESVALSETAHHSTKKNVIHELANLFFHGYSGADVDYRKAEHYYNVLFNSTEVPIKKDSPVGKELYNNRDTATERIKCNEQAVTSIFDTNLKCSVRGILRQNIKRAGAISIRENDDFVADVYGSSRILDGSSQLVIYYHDNIFARATYTFPSNVDVKQIDEIRGFISNKYGMHDEETGRVSLGAASFKWRLEDGIELTVSRGWPITTTYVVYDEPDNYKKMNSAINEQKKERQVEEYEAQSNAF
jgi:hypothetical protein